MIPKVTANRPITPYLPEKIMQEATIRQQLDHTLRETHFTELGSLYKGKVRDTYQAGDKLILITTDRISAFDVVLRQTIPFKGQVLNQLAAFFFEGTKDIIHNHVLSIPDANVTVAQRCEPFPVEFVVRGYLAGHAWREYSAGKRMLCGKPLPEGLKQNSILPEPILTPSTKAQEGHDEDITREEIIRQGLMEEKTFDTLEAKALALFKRGTEMARERGLILVDTKYEFGANPAGDLILIDEVHTPDSSRYFYSDTYESLLETDKPQRQLSKEFVREWLIANDFMGKAGQTLPDLPDDFRVEVSRRYIELFESVTGRAFVPDTHSDPVERIRQVLQAV